MIKPVFFLSILFIHFFATAQTQKVIGDCTVTYSISGDDTTNNNLKGAVLQLYIKGGESRMDIISEGYNQSVIYNDNTNQAIILQEIGGNKYMSKLDAAKWQEQNKKYDGMKITFRPDTKNILGYECKKARVDLKDGSSFTLYYALYITPSTKQNPYKFKDIPGLVLEYQAESDKKNNIVYTASKIDFSPVPSSRFKIPEKGYLIRNN